MTLVDMVVASVRFIGLGIVILLIVAGTIVLYAPYTVYLWITEFFYRRNIDERE